MVLASRIFAPEAAAASFRLAALTGALSGRARRVTVLTVRPTAEAAASAAAPTVPANVTITRWPVLRDAAGVVRGYVQYLSFDAPLALRLLLVARPTVVVSEPPPTTGVVVRVVSALRRVPYVYYAADIWSDAAASTGAPAPLVRVVAAMERWALHGARAVIAVSDGVAARLGELGVDPAAVTVVRNGIDTSVFTPDGPVPVDAPDVPYLVYAGTASEWQGAEIFVEALARVRESVPDARVVFLGQGSAWATIAAQAAALPDGAVELRGAVPPEVAAQWLRGAHGALVSLRPGLGYDFAFPTKVFAAVACGTPVVYAGPGPARAVIGDNALGTVTDFDVESVAAAMVAALTARPSTAARARLAAWVQDNASAARAGAQAAAVVAGTLTQMKDSSHS